MSPNLLKPEGVNEDPLEMLRRCDAYYCASTSGNGKRGSLVGYSTEYAPGKVYVGHDYLNFAVVERHPPLLRHIRSILWAKMGVSGELHDRLKKSTGFCASPEGGKALALMLGDLCDKQYIFPEKHGLEFAFERQAPKAGECWWIVDDVCSNISNTAKMVQQITHHGASVAGIICCLDRTTEAHNFLEVLPGVSVPVVCAIRKQMMEYRQDDPEVVKKFQNPVDVFFDPRRDWDMLMELTKKEADR